MHRLCQDFPGYGTLADWQSRLSLLDLMDALDAVEAKAEAEAQLSPRPTR